MSFEVRVPRLGWSMETGIFLRWLKQHGDAVKVGDPLYELEGEKATQEIEAVDAGVLQISPDAPPPGTEVAVGQLLARILSDAADEAGEPDVVVAAEEKKKVAAASSTPTTSASTSPRANSQKPAASNRILSSPRARRVAGELGVDWKSVVGTGANGRIREKDVRAAAGATNDSRNSTHRRTIAKRMLASSQQSASVTLTRRVDATNLVALRQQFKSAGALIVPSYTDIVAKLTAAVLLRHPELAGRWESDRLVPHNGGGMNIGIAVDTERGLLVPVLQNVDRLDLIELAGQSQRLIANSRNGSVSAADLEGGHFTITNLGSAGIDAFTPIINLPEVAILGLGAIRREAVVVEDDRIVARDVMTLSLTFDHRALDGAPAARFLQTLSLAIENPAASLLSGSASSSASAGGNGSGRLS